MITPQLLKNKIFIAVFLTVVIAVFFALVASWQIFEMGQLKLADYLYRSGSPSSDIIIVAIDDQTVDPRGGLGRLELWNRDYFAKALDNLNKYQPKVVAFDIFFRNARNAEGDQLFLQSLGKTKSPIIVYANNEDEFTKEGFFQSWQSHALPYNLFRSLTNITLGLNTAINDHDNVIRRIIPGIYDKARGVYDESFSFATARKFLDFPALQTIPDISSSKYIMASKTQERAIPLEKGQMLINFVSQPKKGGPTFVVVPFKDLYDDDYTDFNPENFKDKIVLIGASAVSIHDNHFTPMDSKFLMPGVEIHANAIQTILDQKFLRNETLAEKIIVLFLLCLSAAFIFMYTKIRWSVLFLVMVPVIYTLSAPFAFQRGLILDLVHPYLALPTVFIASYIYRYLTEFKEKSALRLAFGKYVNPGVIEQIMAHPEQLRLGGEKREMSVLFTDIAHFTTISENLKPESLVALLNEYFEAMSHIILAEGGTLDKFEGDAVMAFFGAPMVQTDHALRACTAAIKMRYKLHELLEKWKNDPPLPGGEKKPVFDFRCGISSGEMIVGNMGSSERLEYTVMGDIVNLGSRLEGANKKYETHFMVSEATYLAVQEQFEGRELDIIRVVGKTQPIKVYEILALKGDLPENALKLLQLYKEGMDLYHQRKFADALEKFRDILKIYSGDGPSKLYRQRCEVLKDFPPKTDWDGVFQMGSK